MLEGAVLLFGFNGILWPIYYTHFSENRLNADNMSKIISFAGSIVFVVMFYVLSLTETDGKINSNEDSITSIERVVNAFSLIAIIGGGIQFAFFFFRKGQSVVSTNGNMDGGIDYIQM